MNKILVTGGAGFIGSNLVKTLVQKSNYVIVVDNFSQGRLENLTSLKNKKNLKIVKADILDTEKMLKASKGVDVVFHLAVQCLRVSLQNPLFPKALIKAILNLGIGIPLEFFSKT